MKNNRHLMFVQALDLIRHNGWQGWLALTLGILVCLQGLALLASEGFFLIRVAQDVTAPGYSYDAMLGREIDVEFLRLCQAALPDNARVLSMVEEGSPIRYHLYPRYAVHLSARGRTDDLIARNIVAHQITHILIWDPTAYQDSHLLKDARLFDAHDYGAGRMILFVKSLPPLMEP